MKSFFLMSSFCVSCFFWFPLLPQHSRGERRRRRTRKEKKNEEGEKEEEERGRRRREGVEERKSLLSLSGDHHAPSRAFSLSHFSFSLSSFTLFLFLSSSVQNGSSFLTSPFLHKMHSSTLRPQRLTAAPTAARGGRPTMVVAARASANSSVRRIFLLRSLSLSFTTRSFPCSGSGLPYFTISHSTS